jgi:hypothetical protein
MAGIPALTERYRVSYARSATLYAWLQEKRKSMSQGTDDLLALGDPARRSHWRQQSNMIP